MEETSKKKPMDYTILLPANFNSNIYVYRQLLSDKLTELVSHRLSLHLFPYPQSYIDELDLLIQSQHSKFKHVIKTIDILECDNFAFGAPVIESKVRELLDMPVTITPISK